MSEPMQKSQSSLRNDDLIGEELEKLFAFQDRVLTEKKRAILMRALDASGLPQAAIVLGIRKLFNDDLSAIKMAAILGAARSHVEPEDVATCEHCTEGFVPMRDNEGRWFSLACNCAAGRLRNQWQKLSSWKGEQTQLSKGRILNKAEHYGRNRQKKNSGSV